MLVKSWLSQDADSSGIGNFMNKGVKLAKFHGQKRSIVNNVVTY